MDNLPKSHDEFKQFCLNSNIKIHRKIQLGNRYESVFIEFRPLLHINSIISNCINKLNDNWSHTIVCGPDNHEFIKKIVGTKKIKIIIFQQNVKSVNDYNNMLLSIPFWEQFHGEKLLIYQEDSYIFNSNITPFLEYDYIGAPWVRNLIPDGYGGNGGFSLRTKSIMIECLKKHPPPPDNSFTRFDKQAEDLYFCSTMYNNRIGKLAPRKVGVLFSQEQLIPVGVPFGGHKFWDARDHYNYIDIPYKIPAFITLEKTKIPRHFIQTFRDDIHVHKAVVENIQTILKKNPGFDYRLITDQEGKTLIEKHFDKPVLDAFNKLKAGAAKGDFIRYIAMYIYGGMYLDLDGYIVKDMSEFLNYDFVFIHDGSFHIAQWFFMTSPKNTILKSIIDEMVDRILHNEQNIFLATGPTLFTDVIFGLMTNQKLYYAEKNLSRETKKNIVESNLNFMNGLVFFEDSSILTFTFPGYTKDMLYNESNPRYIPTFGGQKSPDLYK